MNRITSIAFKYTKQIKFISLCVLLYSLVLAVSFSYNIYTSFFPLSLGLTHDEAEHLHVAYLLSEGKRPYIDFIENHPTLFNHYLRWLGDVTKATSTRDWAFYARSTIFIHFLICIGVFCCWSSKIISKRPHNWLWISFLICAWAMMGLYNNYLHWIWQIRPDWICYAYTLLGCYLFYLHFVHRNDTGNGNFHTSLLILGGILIGIGNAILPKGIVFLMAFVLTILTKNFINGFNISPEGIATRDIKNCGVFLLAGIFSFLIAMLFDCYLSQISPNKWISGVFLLNQKKHILFTSAENNPITSLTNMFSVSLVVVSCLAIWLVWEVSRLHFGKKNGTGDIIVFSLFIIIINLLLGSYTNGVTWAHYFMPSIFAVAAIYLILLLRVYHLWASLPYNFSRPHTYALSAIIAVVIIHTTAQPVESLLRYQMRKTDSRETRMLTPTDYLVDEVLPKSLVYLTRYPQAMPIRAKHWGYYFMLSGDQDIWQDSYRLGLGPKPSEEWKPGFGRCFPDVIALSEPSEIISFVMELHHCQHVNAGWLIDVIRKNYVPMQHRAVSVYVRRDNVPFFRDRGWNIRRPKNFLPFSSIFYPGIYAETALDGHNFW